MIKQLLLALSLITCYAASAQKEESKEYKLMKEEVEQKIFGIADPLFADNALPGEYKNESAVILAQKRTLETDSRKRFARVGNSFGSGTKYDFTETFREKVYLNDQAALEEYSQISFNKLQKKTKLIFGKSKYYTFINIRVIKPGGAIKKINFDEDAVTTLEEKDGEKTKIAIPDLAVGDIIDYYITTFYQQDRWDYSEYAYVTYILTDDSPVLNYALDLQFDKRLAVAYQCINGAPDFKITPDDDGGNVMRLNTQRLPKNSSLLWTSEARQVSLIRIKYSLGSLKERGMTNLRAGEVVKAINDNENQEKGFMKAAFDNNVFLGDMTGRYDRVVVGEKKKNDLTKDLSFSTPEQVYNYYKFAADYGNVPLRTDYNESYKPISISKLRFQMYGLALLLAKELDIKTELLVAIGRDDVLPENVFSVNDFSVLLRTTGDKPIYFSLDDNLYLVNEIPAALEGIKARVYDYDAKKIEHYNASAMIRPERIPRKGEAVLPVSTHNDNILLQKISISPDPSDMQVLNIKRNASAKGHLRKVKQASLATFEDMALATGKTNGINVSLQSFNEERPKREQVDGPELDAKIKEAKRNQKSKFETEIEETFESKAKLIRSFKITNPGVVLQKPAFEFEEDFSMDGWVKKAGNNYIIDAGKFIGSQFILKPEQRNRKSDIYMSFARSYTYEIEFIIPDGYTAEGADKFNKSVENECGGFTSSAKIEGNKVIIRANRYYIHNFEPAANWGKLTAFIDEATQFNKEKLLLKKK